MLIRVFTLLGSGARLFTRYAVSRLGTKRFLAETAGFVAYAEIVDAAAEHSNWVKKNQDALLALSLLPAGALALRGISGAGYAAIVRRASLFANVSLLNRARYLATYLQACRTKVFADGCQISFNHGRDFIRVMANDTGISYSHSGTKVAAALLASGFGGVVAAEGLKKIDWNSTALQLALAVSDIQATQDKDDLKSIFHKHDSVALLEIGPRLIRNFCEEHPSFSRDKAVAELSRSLFREEEHFGGFQLEAWVDGEGDSVFAINGVEFARDDEIGENQGVLKVVQSAWRTEEPVPQDDQELFNAICSLIDVLNDQGSIDFAMIKDTTRAMSHPVVHGEYAVSLLWDEATRDLSLVYGKDGVFGSAVDGLIDEHEATMIEEAEAVIAPVSDTGVPFSTFGMNPFAPASMPSWSKPQLKSITPIAAKDLVSQLGKTKGAEG